MTELPEFELEPLNESNHSASGDEYTPRRGVFKGQTFENRAAYQQAYQEYVETHGRIRQNRAERIDVDLPATSGIGDDLTRLLDFGFDCIGLIFGEEWKLSAEEKQLLSRVMPEAAKKVPASLRLLIGKAFLLGLGVLISALVIKRLILLSERAKHRVSQTRSNQPPRGTTSAAITPSSSEVQDSVPVNVSGNGNHPHDTVGPPNAEPEFYAELSGARGSWSDSGGL